MKNPSDRIPLLAFAFLLAPAPMFAQQAQHSHPAQAPAHAQHAHSPEGLMADLMKDVAAVQKKFTALAQAMPAASHDWRPAATVRSVREVFLHIASDNYLLPVAVGVQPDPATGISASDFSTLTTYEKRPLSRDAMLAEMDKSFAHLTKAMAGTTDAKLEEKVRLFGQEMTVRQVWLLTAMHLHEHLGQAIAYARSNGVAPPWSAQGG